MDENKLINKLKSLAGYTIKKILFDIDVSVISILKFDKGIIGKLIENYLGLVNNNHSGQDFFEIGLELKTVPVDNYGVPMEDTFICSAKLFGNFDISWENSYIRNKINRILWIPIEVNKKVSFLDRRIGLPILWSPNRIEDMLLKTDWEEIMNFIILGEIEELDSLYGNVLYIKSKAKNSNSLTYAIGNDGENIMVNPKSFYFRRFFTKLILSHDFGYNI